MAKRLFQLPRIDQLTKDQRKVLRLSKEGQYLVVGSPGTGKSVVALLRAKEFSDDDSLFITYNHVLSHSTSQLYDGDIKCETALSWFYSLHWDLNGGTGGTYERDKMPEIKSHTPDYEEVLKRFKSFDKDYSNCQVIIDEGQDLPTGWFNCLVALRFRNFFVVADQNQQITDENSSRSELEEVLGLDDTEVIELKENFRNSTPISDFSNYFYTDKTSPKPDTPDRPSTDTPILFEFSNIDKMQEMILHEYDRDTSKLIGFIVPTEAKREYYAKHLNKNEFERTNKKPIISTYHAELAENVNIDFSYGGIVVLIDKSVKGIEFDIVFVLIDGFKNPNNDIESLQKRLYVISSRAKEKLFFFQNPKYNNVVNDTLPKVGELSEVTGEELLKRRTI
jgi:DNA helicase IV